MFKPRCLSVQPSWPFDGSHVLIASIPVREFSASPPSYDQATPAVSEGKQPAIEAIHGSLIRIHGVFNHQNMGI